MFFCLYALSRFAIEFLRADDRWFLLGLSLPQVMSLIAAVLAVAFLILKRRRALPTFGTTQSGGTEATRVWRRHQGNLVLRTRSDYSR